MDTRLNEVLIIGAGGMGALFGAILSIGGLQVTLVDRDIEHVEAIRSHGLHISGFAGDRLQQIVIETEIGAIKRADLVLVQCKGTSTSEVAESLRPLAASGAVIISFQNGLGNEEIFSEIESNSCKIYFPEDVKVGKKLTGDSIQKSLDI